MENKASAQIFGMSIIVVCTGEFYNVVSTASLQSTLILLFQ